MSTSRPATLTHPVTGEEYPAPPEADIVTCGACHRSWDDSLVTSVTPAPASRCPFENADGREAGSTSPSDVVLSYTETSHTVIVTAPPGVAPMSADAGWKFQPAKVTLKYTIRTHVTGNEGAWRAHCDVTGPWLPKDGEQRPGSACVLPWENLPSWLAAMITEHRPAWVPNLPPAINATT